MKQEATMNDRGTERVITVDWALTKENWKAEKAKIKELRIM